MIRVLQVDDHPALRAGLTAVLRSEPGIVPLGAASGELDLWPALYRTRPDVVVLDYHLPGADGIILCRRIKSSAVAPAVLMFSAYADASLALPARLAGADGVLDKAAPASDLFNAIRTVARGGEVFPEIPRELIEAAGTRVEPEDLPVLGMLLDRAGPADVADALRIDADEAGARIERVLTALKVATPALN